MATNIDDKPYQVYDLSGGIQRKTTKFVAKQNQVDLAINASFKRIGGIEKILGYDNLGNTITTTSSSSTSSSTSTTTTSTSSTTSSTTTSSSTTSSTTTMAP